jgi:hypothetical protein
MRDVSRNPRTLRGTLVALIGVLTLSAVSDQRIECQSGCVNEAVGVADPVVENVIESATANCEVDEVATLNRTMPPDTFMLSNMDITQGAAAEVWGQCIPRGMSGPNCITQPTQDRNFTSIYLGYIKPNGASAPTQFPLRNYDSGTVVYRQTMDSRISSTTNGPRPLSPGSPPLENLGVWFFTAEAITTATNCNIAPTVHPKPLHPITVVACKPAWFLTPPGATRLNIRPQQQFSQVKIAVPLGFEELLGAAQLAADDWKARGFDTNVVPNSTCAPSDPLCVTFETFTGTSCAEIVTPFSPGTGVHAGSSVIRLRSNYATTHPDRMRKRIAHELGHYFGLGNMSHSTCTCANTIMSAAASSSLPFPDSCGDPATPPPCALGPTAEDALKLTRSTFRNQERKICGF